MKFVINIILWKVVRVCMKYWWNKNKNYHRLGKDLDIPEVDHITIYEPPIYTEPSLHCTV